MCVCVWERKREKRISLRPYPSFKKKACAWYYSKIMRATELWVEESKGTCFYILRNDALILFTKCHWWHLSENLISFMNRVIIKQTNYWTNLSIYLLTFKIYKFSFVNFCIVYLLYLIKTSLRYIHCIKMLWKEELEPFKLIS